MLHITNGDATANLLREAGVDGTLLPWRDVLHDGPVPAAAGLEELDRVRIDFLFARGWGERERLERLFRDRAEALASFGDHEAVVLWFEHDLYDQLQILQVLDWFADRELGNTALELVCIDEHPSVDRFLGLGQLCPEHIEPLFARREPVSAAQLRLAQAAWEAFRSPDPGRLEELVQGDCSALPHLRAALERHLEEFPSTRDGLARGQRQQLACACERPRRVAAMFRRCIELEEAPFQGDASFVFQLESLVRCRRPLLRIEDARAATDRTLGFAALVAPTSDGERVLAGGDDYVALNGIDRWLGGVHLCGDEAAWRWDPVTRRLTEAPQPGRR